MKRFLPSLYLLLAPALLHAHDYWLQPETFFPVVDRPVPVQLHLGDRLVSEGQKEHLAKVTKRFQLRSAKGTIDLTKTARDGAKPIISLTCKSPGTHLLLLDRGSHLITLEAKKFEKYLTEEGLANIVAERKKLGESNKAGRERYSRYLKAVLRAGGKGDDTATKVVGQKLEIIPAVDPTGLKVGGSLTVRVLFDGKSLAGARVFALRRDGKKVLVSHKTSAKGEATFKIDKKGLWLVRLVHMRRTTGDKEADWESFWAALTFGVAEK